MKNGHREWCDYPFKGETLRNGAIMAPLLGIIGTALSWFILNWALTVSPDEAWAYLQSWF